VNGILVETDLLVEYLLAGPGEPTLLRALLESITCYTTFVQAAELYSAVRDDAERRLVDRALFGVKILGASSRYAKTIGVLLSSYRHVGGHRRAIVGAIALESRLPVVTDIYYRELSTVEGLRVVQATSLRRQSDRETVLALTGGTS
jgi:predicted nucleic acid-binding protein